MARIGVLIVDDHAMTRELLARCLSAEPDLIVKAVACADACLDELRRFQADVVLMQATLAGSSPFAAARSIAGLESAPSVVFISREIRDIWIEQAFKARARGFISQHEPLSELPAAIRKVADGGFYFSARIEPRLYLEGSHIRLQERPTLMSTLSAREIEVLTHIATGLSSKEIARVMHLSARTVETHAARLMHKLGLRDRVALTRFAIREGLVAL